MLGLTKQWSVGNAKAMGCHGCQGSGFFRLQKMMGGIVEGSDHWEHQSNGPSVMPGTEIVRI